MPNTITIISYLRAALTLSALALVVARETRHASWGRTPVFALSPTPLPLALVIEGNMGMSTSTDSAAVTIPRALAGGSGEEDVSLHRFLAKDMDIEMGMEMWGYGMQDLYCRAENGRLVPVVEC
ncbi:hypothetical protein GGR53DRAFT_503497 [Hypoxylon sp. FL1150]|nr:hypothetical protein GGR53DRAFT_503497 [Hypoxylon sp. FL1150]